MYNSTNIFNVMSFMLQHMQTTPNPPSFLWTPLKGAFSFHSLTSLNETSSEDVSSWKDVTDSYSMKGLVFRVRFSLDFCRFFFQGSIYVNIDCRKCEMFSSFSPHTFLKHFPHEFNVLHAQSQKTCIFLSQMHSRSHLY